MDDPLIGLTIYNTTKSCDSSSQKSNESIEGGVVTSNGVQVGVLRDDVHEDECFPCLPSLPDAQEKKKLDSSPASVLGTKRTENSNEHSRKDELAISEAPQPPQPDNFWLMRLFQSSLFNMSIAIGYLFNSKDPTVQSYLGSRLFVSMEVCLAKQLIREYYRLFVLWEGTNDF